MRYLGGKHSIAKQVAEVLESYRAPGQFLIVPFLGGANVFSRMPGPKIGSDVHPELIALWRAVLAGWQPPEVVTEDDYQRIRSDASADPALRAFVGFGCAFGGRYWGTYAKNDPKNDYAQQARNSLRKKAAGMVGAGIVHSSYADLQPHGDLIYCDPPYAGTFSYAGVPKFDSVEFWRVAERWSQSNTVIVSEATAPSNWKSIWCKTKLVTLNHKINTGTRQEHLFMLEST